MSGSSSEEEASESTTMATSDDFAWMLGIYSPLWWTQVAMRKTPREARRMYPRNFVNHAQQHQRRNKLTASQQQQRLDRVERFCIQLKSRGFAPVKLCPDGDIIPSISTVGLSSGEGEEETTENNNNRKGKPKKEEKEEDPNTIINNERDHDHLGVSCQRWNCYGKLAFLPVFSASNDDEEEDDESDDDDEETKKCSKCEDFVIEEQQGNKAWRCESCAEYWLCNDCYQDSLKFEEGPKETFSAILPPALCGIKRVLWDLEPATKYVLRSDDLPDHGYKYIEGDKEMFHWSGSSGCDQLMSTQRFGQQEGDIGKLRSRLLGLGCDIISSILQCDNGLKLPTPQMIRDRPRHGLRWFWVYPDDRPREGQGEEEDIDIESVELSRNEKDNCEQWLYRGLACMDKSLLSAFRYFAKPPDAPLHCEGHKDRGLLTIVLNPQGLEALDNDTGKWVPMDVDEYGKPLGPNCAVVFSGLTLEKATASIFRATEHRVRNLGGGEEEDRLSVVAKLRCDPDALLDVPWAVRKIRRHDEGPTTVAPEVLTVGDMLAKTIKEGRSVNNIPSSSSSRSISKSNKRLDPPRRSMALLPPPAKKPKNGLIPPDDSAHSSELASLPREVLTQILSCMGVVSLGRLACVNRWLSRLVASHEYCWVSAANDVGMDWVTAVTTYQSTTSSSVGNGTAAVRWNAVLGPRLSLWERNSKITLWLTAEADDAFTNDRTSLDDDAEQIQVDQRTPLNRVVADFMQKHFPNEARAPEVHQGRPHSRLVSEEYNSNLQRINLNLTAWHHELSDGDLLVFGSDNSGMID